jgi:hypothetical protein
MKRRRARAWTNGQLNAFGAKNWPYRSLA